MKQTIHFTKMHGAGNDYIYVNTLLYNIPDPSATAIAWSKPHFGIGSDGLILIGAPTCPDADFSMRIFNNDALDDVGGDVIGRIYEYFLNKFAKNIASDDGVFFTPKSLVKMIVNILEPTGGILLEIPLPKLIQNQAA